jgi:hypothetical protein
MADKMNTKKICQLFHEYCVFAARRSKSMIHVVQRHTSIRCSSQDRERRRVRPSRTGDLERPVVALKQGAREQLLNQYCGVG